MGLGCAMLGPLSRGIRWAPCAFSCFSLETGPARRLARRAPGETVVRLVATASGIQTTCRARMMQDHQQLRSCVCSPWLVPVAPNPAPVLELGAGLGCNRMRPAQLALREHQRRGHDVAHVALAPVKSRLAEGPPSAVGPVKGGNAVGWALRRGSITGDNVRAYLIPRDGRHHHFGILRLFNR